LLEVARREGQPSAIAELEARLAELEAKPPTAEALATRLLARTRDLRSRGEPLDDEAQGLLRRLRAVATASGAFDSLAEGLCAAGGVEKARVRAAALYAEAAELRRGPLVDAEGAIEALGQALALRPEDATLVAELTSLLRGGRELGRLAEALVAHAAAMTGAS